MEYQATTRVGLGTVVDISITAPSGICYSDKYDLMSVCSSEILVAPKDPELSFTDSESRIAYLTVPTRSPLA
jgi:hypothetical protein